MSSATALLESSLLISLSYMLFVFQAKEQGKADVEELLSKLEKVKKESGCYGQIHLHGWCLGY